MSKKALQASLRLWRRRHAWRQRRLDVANQRNDAKAVAKWKRLRREAAAMITRREQQLVQLRPLRLWALTVANSLIGVMEEGGNNAGPTVTKIIRANGGTGPEPWCGDFVAYCYRLAGSKSVTRSWAAVRLLFGLAGIKRVEKPLRGDLVRFTFSHVGLYVRDLGNGEIETIEGNTGASGAVSDSKTGGDGVYRKRRSKTLVQDYLRVTR